MKLFDEEFNEWIASHRNDDVAKLRLKYAGSDETVKEAISQIEYTRKAGDKFGGMKLWFPTSLSVEQATSVDVARFHASFIKPRSKVLDMTMGLGVDAATIATTDDARVTAVERDARLCEFAAVNYRDIPNLTVINADSVEWLRGCGDSFDYIFIDPARRDVAGKRVYNIHDCTPDVAELLPLLFQHAPCVLVKLSPMLDISATIKDLQHVSAIYVVEERGEVRELLAYLEKDTVSDSDNTDIVVVDGDSRFAFTRAQEAAAVEMYAEPAAGGYLYEPSAAVMKAAPFKLLCERYNIGALHPNTHLYVSENEIAGFPGKCYRIEAVIPYASKYIKRFSRDYPSASVSVRNFPITAAALRAKLKVKDSATPKVYGVTIKGGNQVLIIGIRL